MWIAAIEGCDVIGSKMESDSTKVRLLPEICILCCSNSLSTPSRLKHLQQHSAGNGLRPLRCRVTGSLLHILRQCQKAVKEKSQSFIMWRHDSSLLAIHKSVKERIKEAAESRVEAQVEDSID